MRTLRLAVPALALLIAGCGGSDDADPGGISSSEAQELNDAAAMLDADAIEIDALANTGNAS